MKDHLMTTDAPSLEELLKRVEAATGSDRQLSVALWYALHPDREHLWSLSGMNAQRGPRQNTERDLHKCVAESPTEYGWRATDDDYTSSLDAALGLAMRVQVDALNVLLEAASTLRASQDNATKEELARAVVIALLKAVQAKGGDRG